MLQNYLKIAFRVLWKNQIHSIINISGLGLGIACCVLIALFIQEEWTYDAFHANSDNTYRAYVQEEYDDNQVFLNTVTPFPLGQVLEDHFEEIQAQVRITPLAPIIKVGASQFNDPVIMTSPDFFTIFDFESNREAHGQLLEGQNNAILTETVAVKFFGNDNAVNNIISIQLGEIFQDFVVKAVIKDAPSNSSIQFGILISDLNLPKIFSDQALTSGWFNVLPETYVSLQAGVDQDQLTAKFPAVFRSILGEKRFRESNYKVGLQPLTSVHLDSSFPEGIAPVSNPNYSYILSAIALLILLVACINFVTLAMGRSLKRTKEVGIRKVVGAIRKQLMVQFIGEALITAVISIALGLLLAKVFLPLFNDLSGKSLVFHFDFFFSLVILLLMVFIGLIAGSYPAYFLSTLKPISMLKGKIASNGKQNLRKALVGIQLIVSIFLISSTLVMREQLNHLQNKYLGFDKEQLAVISLNVVSDRRLPQIIKKGFEKAQQLQTEVTRLPGVLSSAVSTHDFGDGDWTNIGYTDDLGTYRNFNMNVVDWNYIPSLKMELVMGRNFSQEITSDVHHSIIINEAFVSEYGWEDPLGQHIPGNYAEHQVVGVVKDFNYSSLYTDVEPLVLVLDPTLIYKGMEDIGIDNSPVPKLLVRLSSENMVNTIAQIKTIWNQLTGGEEFDLSFVDQRLNTQYRNDQNLSKMVNIATLIAIIIGSFGLYALASLAMQSRVKEVSIRRVMGAPEKTLLWLLSKDYLYLVIVSLTISIPVTWYIMNNWLSNFEFRIPIGTDVFLLAGGASMLIALGTIAYETLKTANANPTDVFKQD